MCECVSVSVFVCVLCLYVCCLFVCVCLCVYLCYTHQLLVNTNTHQLSVNTNIYYTIHCIEVRKYRHLEYQLGQCCHSDTVR